MVISQINSKNNFHFSSPSINQKISIESNPQERATLASATSGESKTCFQTIIDFFSSLLSAIKKLLCCENSRQRGNSKQTNDLSKEGVLSKETLEQLIEGHNEGYTSYLIAAMQKSGISSCQFKKILVADFRNTQSRMYFEEADGQFDTFNFQDPKYAGSILLISLEVDPGYNPEIFEACCPGTQPKLRTFLEEGNRFICLSNEEFVDVLHGKLPERLIKLIQG